MLYLWTRYPFPIAEVGVSLTQCSQHRARFQPNLFHHETPGDPNKSATPVNAATEPPTLESGREAHPRPRPKFGFTRWGINAQRLSSQEQHRDRDGDRRVPSNPRALSPETKPPSGTPSNVSGRSEPIPPVQEVWFAGCHSDVGGGAVEDTVRYSLADISLRWMVKQVILSQCGIRFDTAALRRADIHVSTIVHAGPMRTAAEQILRSESEAGASSPTSPGSSGENGSREHMIQKGKERDVKMQAWPREQDVLADIHDELKSKPMWWPLELMPMKFTWQEADGTWKSKWGYVVTTSAHPA